MRILRLCLVTIVMSGCALLSHRKIEEPKVELANLTVQGVNARGATLLFGVKVDNPNPFKLKVDSVKYGVELGGKGFAEGEINKPTEVDAKSTTIVHVPVEVKFADIFTSIGDFLRQEGTAYRLHGRAKLGLISVPFDEKGEFKFEGSQIKHFKK